jgi:hypothetical protein
MAQRPRTALDLATSTTTWVAFQNDLARRPLVRDDWYSLTSRPWVRGPVEAILANEALLAAVAEAEGGGDTAESESLSRLRELVEALDGAWQRLEMEEAQEKRGWLLRRVAFASACPAIYSLMDSAESALTPDRIARLERLGEGALTAPRLAKLARALHGALEEAGRAADSDDNTPLQRGALLAARAARGGITDPFLEGVLVSIEACADSPDVSSLVDATLFGAEPSASPPLPSWPSSASTQQKQQQPHHHHRHHRRPLRVRDRALLRFAAELDAAVGPSAAVPRRLLALLVRVAGEAAAVTAAAAATEDDDVESKQQQQHAPPPPPEEAAPALMRALLPSMLTLQPHLPRYDGMARRLAQVDALMLEPWLRELLCGNRLRRYASALATLAVTGGESGKSAEETGGSLGAALRAVARVFADAEPSAAEHEDGASPGPSSPVASYWDAEEWHHPRGTFRTFEEEEDAQMSAVVASSSGGSAKANATAAAAAAVLGALDALAAAPEAAGRALDALSVNRRRVEALRLLRHWRQIASLKQPQKEEAKDAAIAAAAASDADDDNAAAAVAAGTLSAAAAALERAVALSGQNSNDDDDDDLLRRIRADDEAYEATAGAYCLVVSGPQSEDDNNEGAAAPPPPPPPPPTSPTRSRSPVVAATAPFGVLGRHSEADDVYGQRLFSLAAGALLTATRLLGPKNARAVVGAALKKPPSPGLGRAFDAMLLLELLRMRRRRQQSSSLGRVVRQEAVLGARVVAALARGAAEQFW